MGMEKKGSRCSKAENCERALPVLDAVDVVNTLRQEASERLQDFNARLIPTIERDRILGVTIPTIRRWAKFFLKETDVRPYLDQLPHFYWEEQVLHGELLNTYKTYEELLPHLECFLPYITDWATCDTLAPKALAKQQEKLLTQCQGWLGSAHEYTVRFAIVSCMTYFLKKDFRPEVLDWIAAIQRPEYYIQMAQGWFFAEGVLHHPTEVMPYLSTERLLPEVLNKALQKACESRRCSEEDKARFRTMKVKVEK